MKKVAKNRSVRLDNLEDDNEINNTEGNNSSKLNDEVIDTNLKETPSGPDAEIPSLDQSPLLNSGRIERPYTAGNPTEQPPQSTPAKEQPVEQQKHPDVNDTSGYTYHDEPAPQNVLNNQNLNPEVNNGNAPAPINKPSASGDETDTLDIPEQAAKQGSKDLGVFVMDAYERFVPEIGHYFSKMNAKEVKKLEESGSLLEGAYEMVKTHNKENRAKLEEQAKKDSAYIKKHLVKVLQVRQISASPEALLVMAFIFVIIGQGIMIMRMNSDNQDFMDKLMAKVNSNRNFASPAPKKEEEILEPKVEEV